MANIYNVFGQDGSSLYQGNSYSKYQSAQAKQIATLQNPAGGGAGGSAGSFNVPSAGNIELPPWLKGNADSQMGELLQSYAGVGAAFDPTSQVNARNESIGYNTAAGTQAANNAAMEYANRAQQSGGSSVGAGVVKAQAMLPVFQQNAALKSDAADVAAKAHQDAAGLAANIASTIGNLRTSYLNTLTGYTQGQQGMQMDAFRLNSANANAAMDRQLEQQRLTESQRQFNVTSTAQKKAQLAATHRTAAPNARPSMSIYPTMTQGPGQLGYAPEYLAANQSARGLIPL